VSSDERLRALERKLREGDEAATRAYGRLLVRLGRATEDEAQLLDAMGSEAWFAWGTGGEFEEHPESVESGDVYAEHIEARDRDVPDEDDPHGDGTWTSGWSVSGLAVRRHTDGSPKIVRTHWTVDSDGNWDSAGEDEWPVGSPHAELDQARHYRDNRRSWVEYYAWIAGTHRDPIGDLNLTRRRTPDAKWRFTLEQRKTRGRDAVVVTKATRRRGKKWASVPLASLPESIWLWLSAEAPIDEFRRFLVTTIENLDVVRANNKIVKDTGDALVIETTIQGEVIQPSDREIQNAARRAEVRAGEELAKAQTEVERLRAFAPRCGRCNQEIQEIDGSWVDVTDGDDCDGGVHAPETEHERLLGRDRPEDMERDEGPHPDLPTCCHYHESGGDADVECREGPARMFECDRCGGTFSDAEAHSTPEGQVICDACFERE
jgi:hypothetical protein